MELDSVNTAKQAAQVSADDSVADPDEVNPDVNTRAQQIVAVLGTESTRPAATPPIKWVDNVAEVASAYPQIPNPFGPCAVAFPELSAVLLPFAVACPSYCHVPTQETS